MCSFNFSPSCRGPCSARLPVRCIPGQKSRSTHRTPTNPVRIRARMAVENSKYIGNKSPEKLWLSRVFNMTCNDANLHNHPACHSFLVWFYNRLGFSEDPRKNKELVDNQYRYIIFSYIDIYFPPPTTRISMRAESLEFHTKCRCDVRWPWQSRSQSTSRSHQRWSEYSPEVRNNEMSSDIVEQVRWNGGFILGNLDNLDVLLQGIIQCALPKKCMALQYSRNSCERMWITSIHQRMSKRRNNRPGRRDEYCLHFTYLTLANMQKV